MGSKRPNGEGMIRRRGASLWEGRVIIGNKSNGNPIYKYVYDKRQKDLVEKLHKVMDLYKDSNVTDDSFMTLGEWMDKWLLEYKSDTIKKSTINGYEQSIEHFIKPALGDIKLIELKPTDIQKMYTELGKTNKKIHVFGKDDLLSPTTIRSTHFILHQALEKAKSLNLIPSNPAEGLTIPARATPEKSILDDSELDIFMRAIDNEPLWHDLFYTEITTGLRRGEICGLKWDDVDFDMGTLSVRRTLYRKDRQTIVTETKTEKSTRKILLPKSTLEVLKRRKKTSVSKWIFPNFLKPEEPLNPQTAYTNLKRILKEAGLPNIRFHDLRHTFATHALSLGVDPKTLSGILGHTNASFTLDTYTHVTGDMQKNASRIVENFVDDIFGEMM